MAWWSGGTPHMAWWSGGTPHMAWWSGGTPHMAWWSVVTSEILFICAGEDTREVEPKIKLSKE